MAFVNLEPFIGERKPTPSWDPLIELTDTDGELRFSGFSVQKTDRGLCDFEWLLQYISVFGEINGSSSYVLLIEKVSREI